MLLNALYIANYFGMNFPNFDSIETREKDRIKITRERENQASPSSYVSHCHFHCTLFRENKTDIFDFISAGSFLGTNDQEVPLMLTIKETKQNVYTNCLVHWRYVDKFIWKRNICNIVNNVYRREDNTSPKRHRIQNVPSFFGEN